MQGKFFLLVFIFVLFFSSFAVAEELKADGEACLNDFECSSDSCVEQKCGSLYAPIVENEVSSSFFEGEFWNLITGVECDPTSDVEGLGYKCEERNYFSCGASFAWEGGVEVAGECGVAIIETQSTCTDQNFEEKCSDIPEAEVICSEDGASVMNRTYESYCDTSEVNVCTYDAFEDVKLEDCATGNVCSEGACIVDPSLGECTVDICVGQVNNICSDALVLVPQGLVNGVCGYSSGGSSSSPMRIVITSPIEGTIYSSKSVSLQVYDSKKRAKYWRYSLNNGAKTSFTPNATIIAKEGANKLVVYSSKYRSYASESSKTVNFKVNVPSPSYSGGVCGDNVCDLGESSSNCFSDCGEPSEIDACGDNVCSYEDGENSFKCPADCDAEEKTSYLWLLVVIIIMIIFAVVVAGLLLARRLGDKPHTKPSLAGKPSSVGNVPSSGKPSSVNKPSSSVNKPSSASLPVNKPRPIPKNPTPVSGEKVAGIGAPYVLPKRNVGPGAKNTVPAKIPAARNAASKGAALPKLPKRTASPKSQKSPALPKLPKR